MHHWSHARDVQKRAALYLACLVAQNVTSYGLRRATGRGEQPLQR